MAPHLKTAIVTGGCSGIGLGLVKHLLSKPDWRVVLADIRPEAYDAIKSSLDPDRHTFIETDVSSWPSQAALFKQAFTYSDGRIDFLAANAGTAEKVHLLDPSLDDLDTEPTQPSMLATEVNQFGPIYGLKLFVHYARLTNRALKSKHATSTSESSSTTNGTSVSTFNPKVVITSSCTALYPFPVAVQYAASKAAIFSLVRSVGKNLLASDNVAVNCIMPAYVDTNLTPDEVTALWPKEWVTPLSTMNRAYDELIDKHGRVEQDGKSDGKDGKVKAGKAVECACDKLYYRNGVEYADESQKFCIEQSFYPDGLWMRGMIERMKKTGSII
ncbi:hypothetical protein EDD37DRAFT_204952 [Exophiala viscosa]|uniref:Uncharacterized protein n=1 Tax=Exophiala viscosa TaxID=2486360 RepID=A0AAN6I9W7_9EURO|nr:hypothetical protein EDD36DRAFT_446488 [Exophiala viscosa]KAI1619703.1 hypothetical protein EDD37DRAFT_204952 [Exophiala viscosa]